MNPLMQALIGYVFIVLVVVVVVLVDEAGTQAEYRRRVAAETKLEQDLDVAIDITGGLR